ncbi:MAG: hypothetical protein HQK93_07220 [Nitrospirae bacterium]|nr:hypothetical protein [Nitrospirota bacterium]
MKPIILNWFSTLMTQAIFPVLAGILSIIILRGLERLNCIFKLSIDEQTLKNWSDIISHHVFAVEEMNAKFIKDDPQKLTQKIMTSDEKMDYVVQETLKSIGDKITHKQVKEIAHSIIAKTPKLGATG